MRVKVCFKRVITQPSITDTGLCGKKKKLVDAYQRHPRRHEQRTRIIGTDDDVISGDDEESREAYGLSRGLHIPVPGMCGLIVCFVADVAFQVGKILPPPTYHCDTWGCRKVTHVCVMTMGAFVFGMYDQLVMFYLHMDNRGVSCSVSSVKSIQYLMSLVFILYEQFTNRTDNLLTYVAVSFSSVFEVLLLVLEGMISSIKERKSGGVLAYLESQRARSRVVPTD